MYKGIQNQYVMQRLMLMLKREVESLHGSRVEMAALIDRVSALIGQFNRTFISLTEDKKVFKKIVEGDLTLNAIYSTIRYKLDLDNTYESAYFELEDTWTKYCYQVMGIKMPEDLI
jgi:hypothetical protein